MKKGNVEDSILYDKIKSIKNSFKFDDKTLNTTKLKKVAVIFELNVGLKDKNSNLRI